VMKYGETTLKESGEKHLGKKLPSSSVRTTGQIVVKVEVDRSDLDRLIEDVEAFKRWAEGVRVPWWWRPLRTARIRYKLTRVKDKKKGPILAKRLCPLAEPQSMKDGKDKLCSQ